MKKTLLAIAVFACIAASAQAVTVAGWDFSQYQEAGLLSTDGSTFASALAANYSAYDSTFNAGAGAAAFGTLHFDGAFGSTSVAQTTPATTAFAPTTGSPQGTGSLDSNLQGPVQTVVGTLPHLAGPPLNSFESFSILKAEGQAFQHALSMTARSPVDIVFAADTSSLGAGEKGVGWSVHFAGKTFPRNGSTTTSDVGVEYSTNGSSYSLIDTLTLTDQDQAFDVKLSGPTGTGSQTAFVRFSLDPTSGQPIIDNVSVNAIYVPEPGRAVQLASGALGLVALYRRRRRA